MLGYVAETSINNLSNNKNFTRERYTDIIKKEMLFDSTDVYKQDLNGHILLDLGTINLLLHEGRLNEFADDLRIWFKTPISKVLLSFDNIEIVILPQEEIYEDRDTLIMELLDSH